MGVEFYCLEFWVEVLGVALEGSVSCVGPCISMVD